VAEADRTISAASPILAQGEGGIVHYRNAYPRDPHLRWWSALVSAATGASAQAAAESAAAVALGLPPGHSLPGLAPERATRPG
jgi:hypothetical protein